MSDEQGYTRMSFGDALRLRRQRAGLDQEDLARALHTHQSTIARWERQTTPPRDKAALEVLAGILGATVDELRGGLVPATTPYSGELAGLPIEFVQELNKYARDLKPEDRGFVIDLVKRLAAANKPKRSRPGSADADYDEPASDEQRPNTAAQMRFIAEGRLEYQPNGPRIMGDAPIYRTGEERHA